VLNNHRNPQWYYGYESGSTKAQRGMKHVLAAYVLLLHPLPDHHLNRNSGRGDWTPPPAARLATVVARQASTSFTMISYRRQNDARRSQKHVTRGEVAAASAARRVDNTEIRAPADQEATPPLQSQRSQPSTAEANAIDEQRRSYSVASSSAASEPPEDAEEGMEAPAADQAAGAEFSPLGLPSPRRPLCCPICRGPLLSPPHPRHIALHRDTIDRLQALLVLQLFLRLTPLDACSFAFRPMDFRIQRQWLAQLSPHGPTHRSDVQTDPSACRFVADVASAFSLSDFVAAGSSQRDAAAMADPVLEQVVLQSCSGLLLDALLSTRLQHVLSMGLGDTRVHQQGEPPNAASPLESCEQFAHMVEALYVELTELLEDRHSRGRPYLAARSSTGCADGHLSIPELVDDVLSLIFAEPKYESLRRSASAWLLRRDDSLEAAARALFRAFLVQQQRVRPGEREAFGHESQPGSASNSEGGTWSASRPANAGWSQRWFLDPASVLLTPASSGGDSGNPAAGASTASSVLSCLALVRMLGCVDIWLEGLELSIDTAVHDTAQQPSTLPGAVFVLDGRSHALKSLPNGLSSAALSALLAAGWDSLEYEGRLSPDGSSLELLLETHSTPMHEDRATSIVETMTAWRVRLRLLLDEARDDRVSCFSLSADVWAARDPSQHSNRSRTLSNQGLDDARWLPKVEVQATYVGLSE
jgi:hypothetical protein